MAGLTSVSYLIGINSYTVNSTSVAVPACDTAINRALLLSLYTWAVNSLYPNDTSKQLALTNFKLVYMTASWDALRYNIANTFGVNSIPTTLQPHMTCPG